MKRYIAKDIEPKWRDQWKDMKLFKTEIDPNKPKKYILDMFPYPSGEGLHVGHFKPYTASDVLTRFYRAQGFNVLHPMGWDAFGLPAENYAIKMGVHPKITTANNIANIKRQMELVNLSYDWDREIDTTDPKYFKWTQWIFLKLFEKGLAYESEVPINWCPKDKTGLANEEVVGGACERCGTKVERRVIRQWILKITAFADRLAEDVKALDWPDSIKDMQINWIGKSEGSLIKFTIDEKDYELETYTTRIDTISGVTAVVIAPEHPRVSDLTTPKHKEPVGNYLEHIKSKSDLERTELNKDKTGVFTGSYAINPVNGEKIPVWIADYVLGFYGTGAVMLVPGHDERDYEFAKKYDLPVKQVIKITDNDELPTQAYGHLINSGQFDGLSSDEAKKAITSWLKKQGKGDFQTNYKIRDWIFSRQRYWGEPIPLVHCKECGIVPVPENELPVTLPEVEQYEPTGTGESPLAGIDEWVNVKCPKCGKDAKRETNTMPQWAGSCWYYLRFCDPQNDQNLIAQDVDKYWMPVDWYLGSADHAVLHLLYSRFWHKFLYDLGVISTNEPFMKLSSVGFVLGPDGNKMSKSKGNVIVPDDIVREYGADTLRLYESFMGPFETSIAWDPDSIIGVYKFLGRIWELIQKDEVQADPDIELKLNKTIVKVMNGIEQLKLNTSIASMMEFLNAAAHKGLSKDQKEKLLIILSPFAPYITEELWELIGNKASIHTQKWPQVDKNLLDAEDLTIVVQVNGKVRANLTVPVSLKENQPEIEKLAKDHERVERFIDGAEIKKVIFVPGKIINFLI